MRPTSRQAPKTNYNHAYMFCGCVLAYIQDEHREEETDLKADRRGLKLGAKEMGLRCGLGVGGIEERRRR